jgi:hypothetical protein
LNEKLTIVPLAPGSFSEADWIFRLFRSIETELLPWSGNIPVIPEALYLHHGPKPLSLADAFLTSIREAGGCGLLHLGDEYFQAAIRQYGSFDYVVRMFPRKAARHEGVLTIPVGYTRGMGDPVHTPASQRQYMWMFAGDWKADRSVMAEQFGRIPGGFLSLTKSFESDRPISRGDYLSTLSRSAFAPSPAGNVLLETCRPFEALELGAIPIVPRRRRADPFADHFGKHPLPSFMDWSEARGFVERLSRDSRGLDLLQDECLSWWEAEKDQLSDKLISFIAAGRRGALSDGLRRQFGQRSTSPVERFLELLAQQNAQQIAARATFHFGRAFAKYILRSDRRGIWSVEGTDASETQTARPDREVE